MNITTIEDFSTISSAFELYHYEDSKTINGRTYHLLEGQQRADIKTRVIATIKALAFTVLTGGIALFFESVRKLWNDSLDGRRSIKAYVKEDQEVKKVVNKNLEFWNLSLETLDQRDQVLESIRKHKRVIPFLPKRWRMDEEVARTAIQQHPMAFLDLADEIQNEELMIFALNKMTSVPQENSMDPQEDASVYNTRGFLSPNQRKAGALHRRILSDTCSFFIRCPKKLTKSRTTILAIIKNTTCSLVVLPQEFSKDKEIVREAIKKDHRGSSFVAVAKELQNDKAFVLELVKLNPLVIKYISDKFKSDPEVQAAAR